MTFDEAAEHLHEAGYPVVDKKGRYDPNVLSDRLSDELRGRRHYSTHNTAELAEREHAPDWRQPLSEADLAKLSLEETRQRLDALREEQDRLEREIERAGLTEGGEPRDRDLEEDPVAERGEGRGQRDLFGDNVEVKNQIKRLEAALDKKRNTGQESVETGKPGDLFSAARQQMELPTEGGNYPL